MFSLIKDFAIILLVTAFFTSLLIYCLRMGVVGGGGMPWQRNAHRDKQPIRYWTGIMALALGTGFSWLGLLYVLLLELRG